MLDVIPEYLIDTNVLLRLRDTTAVEHPIARTAIQTLRDPLTFNGAGFSRYPGIQVVHPSSV